jgi:hypothetical protein
MIGERANNRLPAPWSEFLAELDAMLTEPLAPRCIGGFALVHFYGLPRTTGDIHYFTAVPANLNLDEIAGQGSPLHHKVWLHCVGVANLPEEYETRLSDMAPGEFRNLRLLVLDPYDCILSKLERASAKDRDDANYLFRSQKLNPQILRLTVYKRNAS